MWSLGVVMWEMLVREMPYQDLTPQQILMGLMCGNLSLDAPAWCEPEWRGLLEACLEPNPGNRPSMKELARQLEAIRDDDAQRRAAAAAAEAAAQAGDGSGGGLEAGGGGGGGGGGVAVAAALAPGLY